MEGSKHIKAVVIDDEEIARDLLTDLLNQFCPEVEVVGTFSGLPDAVKPIKTNQPDIVFLDIEMPNYSGLEIRKFFPAKESTFEVVFVTAYERYALRAFEVSAVDYLLKPVSIERLKEAVKRIAGRKQKGAESRYDLLEETIASQEVKRIMVFVKGEHKVVEVDSIIAIQADDAYSSIYTTNGDEYLVTKTLKHFDDILEENRSFVRSHKSWLVNLAMVESFALSKGDIQLQNNIVAKLSKYRKEAFENALNSL